MIVATGQKNEIGRNNQLMWHLPDDFKWFIQTYQAQDRCYGS